MEKKYQLPKEFAEKWVKALRSGEHKQIKGSYIKDGCYCAMGLGFMISGAVVGEIKLYGAGKTPLKMFDIKSNIISLNDEKGKSFPEIADWIEANIEFI